MLILKRVSMTYERTLGVLNYDGKLYTTLERPPLNNARNISCIPAGLYRLTRYTSPKFGNCFWVHDVPNRSSILIHAGNRVSDTRGCILIGQGYDPHGIIQSKSALRSLYEQLTTETELKIIEV